MNKIYSSFFHLLRRVHGCSEIDWQPLSNLEPKDWERLYLLSKRQGVVAIIFDSIKDIPKQMAPPKPLVLRWLSHSLAIEREMKIKEEICSEFAARLFDAGVQVAVLKGMAFASYFHNPLHRESGDLDCYVVRNDGGVDVEEFARGFGAQVQDAGYKHSHIHYKGLTIEKHHFLTSFDNSKRGIETEKLLQKMVGEAPRPIGETKLLNPSADFNALFLIKHALRHFMKEGICIRHLLDWSMFLLSEGSNVDWQRVIALMHECRILNFAIVLTGLCCRCFGVESGVPQLSVGHQLEQSVLEDIMGEKPNIWGESGLQKVRRMFRRLRRMWRFRSIADESFVMLVFGNVTFSKYFNRRPKI